MTRAFGRTGLEVPVLGFGAMQVGDPMLAEEAVARLLHHVLDRGLTLIDTARSYGLAEERIGRHLAARRDEFVLSTKVGYGVPGVADWTYECIVRGVDAARERLRTDEIDIVHLHSCGLDVLRAGEVTRGLLECVARGRVRVAAYSGDDAPLRFAVEAGALAAEVARRSGASGPGAGAATGNSGHVSKNAVNPSLGAPAATSCRGTVLGTRPDVRRPGAERR
jgi:aryl-alcohol dehydrogenase-like predicted oxidoreductase